MSIIAVRALRLQCNGCPKRLPFKSGDKLPPGWTRLHRKGVLKHRCEKCSEGEK